MPKSTEFDLIIFGATSFVGQLICRYLLQRFPPSAKPQLRWAMAGRSMDKLHALRRLLDTETIPCLIADASLPTSLATLCARTSVIASTVGPYALYGDALVAAAVEAGINYLDLTGETPWMQKMIETHAQRAKKTGAIIVHAAGFDSVPSDCGVWFLQTHAEKEFGRVCQRVSMRVKMMRGGLSGGTVASMMNLIKLARTDKKLRRTLVDPYALCDASVLRVKQSNLVSARFDVEHQSWSAPFLMAGVNTRIVLRTHALGRMRYGKNFTYDEAMLTGPGTRGRIMAFAISGGMAAMVVAGSMAPTRWVLERFILPAPGQGPSALEQANGGFDLHFVGYTEKNQRIQVRVTGDRDPGYGSTAKMFGEVAAALALDVSPNQRGGFYTPAALFGQRLIDRLVQNAGITFEVLRAGKQG